MPAVGRQSILGGHGWNLDQEQLDRFFGAPGDPVSEAAGRSVAQLIDNFPAQGLVDAIAATVYARTLLTFFLGDSAAHQAQGDLLHKRRDDDPLMTCLTAVAFAACAAQLWTVTTGETLDFWVDMMSETALADLDTIQIVQAASEGVVTTGIPDDTHEQKRITVELCDVITVTLRLTADLRSATVVTVMQDLLIAIQRLRAAPPDDAWLASHNRPRSLDS